MFASLLHLGYAVETAVEWRAALFLQEIEGEDHVIRRYRLAIRPFRLGVDVELNEAALVVPLHGFGEQPIEAEGLVAGARHQRLVKKIAEFRIPNTTGGGAHSLENEGVQAVESADHAIRNAAAFLHVRIDIRKV